jgi:hypothetical protein
MICEANLQPRPTNTPAHSTLPTSFPPHSTPPFPIRLQLQLELAERQIARRVLLFMNIDDSNWRRAR